MNHYVYKPNLDHVLLEPLDVGDLYVVARPLTVNPMVYGIDKSIFTVPRGFITDGASIPRFFWRIIDNPFAPRIITGGTVHDFLFSKDSEELFEWDFESANILFHAIMRAHGVREKKADLMCYAITRFGRGNYQAKYSWEKLQ